MKDILYLVSTSGKDSKYGIKFGCSKDFEQRKKTYNTHNPFAEFPCFFVTPNRSFSEALEDALLRKIGKYRKNKTEWYIVSVEIYSEFQDLKSYQDIFAFCNFFGFLYEKIQVYESRLIDSCFPRDLKNCKDNIEHYKILLKMAKELL